jgi:hypothetical protein
MFTIESARRVKNGMQKGTGCKYAICADTAYGCYRVLPESDYRVNYVLPRVE